MLFCVTFIFSANVVSVSMKFFPRQENSMEDLDIFECSRSVRPVLSPR